MQYHVSTYGVFSPLCPQVYAFDQNTTLEQNAASTVVNKAIFTLGLDGQANTIQGVAGGVRYASNLKWSYPSAFPTTDDQFHQSNAVSDGCSRGESDFNLSWSSKDTVFLIDHDVARPWSFGKCAASTGAQSPRLNILATLMNELATPYNAVANSKVSINTYAVLSLALPFKYLRNTNISVDAGSYSYRIIDGLSDMRVFCQTNELDEVKAVAKYECVRAGKLFRFMPEDLNFGSLVPGTRPKVQSYLKATYYL